MNEFLPTVNETKRGTYRGMSDFWGGGSMRRYREYFRQNISLSPVELLSIYRSIAQFVTIGTDGELPLERVKFVEQGNSAVDYKKNVFIRYHSDPDVMVGLTLHEATHVLRTDMKLFEQLSEVIKSANPGLYTGDFWKELNTVASQLHNKTGMGYDKALQIFFSLANWIEDRRIDTIRVKMAPGYKGYYDAVYNEYLYTNKTGELLRSKNLREESVEAYMFRIFSMMHPDHDPLALKRLALIERKIDISNILRHGEYGDGTWSVFQNAMEVYKILASAVDKEKSSNADKSRPMNNNSKGSGNGQDGNGEKNKTDNKDSNDGNNGTSSGKKENDKKSEKGEGGTSGDSDENKKEDKEKNKDGGTGDTEEDEFLNAIDQYLAGDNVDEAIAKALESLEKSEKGNKKDGADPVTVNKAIETAIKKAFEFHEKMGKDQFQGTTISIDKASATALHHLQQNKVQIHTLNQSNDHNKKIMGMYFPTWKSGQISGTSWYAGPVNSYKNNIIEAIRLGKIAARKLRQKVVILNETKKTSVLRKRTGRIDRKLLSGASFSEEIFSRTDVISGTNYLLHIDLDASSSMDREDRWPNAIQYATMVVFATEGLKGIDVKITIRGLFYKDMNNHYPALLTVYDSRVDKANDFVKRAQLIHLNSNTPESLLYELGRKVAEKTTERHNKKYFITVTDGEPQFGDTFNGDAAIDHCKNEMIEFEKRGFKVQAYFIGSGGFDSFTKAYGKKGEVLDAKNVKKIAEDLKKLLLSK